MFEPSVFDKLDAYVYALIDPVSGLPFYIGKGRGNRVFSHANCALEDPESSDKYETIKKIMESGHSVKHVIIRHGMKDDVAFEVECALLDLCSVIDHSVTNIVSGHRSSAFGVMTADEIIRKYKAEPLDVIEEGFVVININKTYERAKGSKSYYQATKESWPIDKSKLNKLRYVLSEYKGFIVEVFKVELPWYPVETTDKNGKSRTRWGFNGVVAEDEVRSRYLNKSITKKVGAAFPIRYKL